MHYFKIKNVNSDVFVLNVNNQFMKYIKKSDLDNLKYNIESYLGQIAYKHSQQTFIEEVDGTFTYNLDVDSEQFRELQNLFLLGTDKKKIDMPQDLLFSKEEGKPVFYSYRSVENFIKYWSEADSTEKKYNLYRQLSEDLIEIPYVDNPKDYMFRFNRIAYHTNHGTTHGLRLTKYFNHYLQAIKLYGDSENKKKTAMSREEEHCLELALFLFRSGRTNELGWSGDPSYSPRSAVIFTQIAIELGFNTRLVKEIAECFDYKKTLTNKNSVGEPSAATGLEKASLYQGLFKLCHQSDLIRCFTSYSEIAGTIEVELALRCIFQPEYLKEFVFKSLVFAAICCKKTGASVMVSELHEASKTTYNECQIVTVKSVHNVLATCETLDQIATSTMESVLIPDSSLVTESHVSFFSSKKKHERTLSGSNMILDSDVSL